MGVLFCVGIRDIPERKNPLVLKAQRVKPPEPKSAESKTPGPESAESKTLVLHGEELRPKKSTKNADKNLVLNPFREKGVLKRAVGHFQEGLF